MHTVKYGETLFSVARKYPDIPIRKIISLNHLTDISLLQEGQILKVKTTKTKAKPRVPKKAQVTSTSTQPATASPPPQTTGSVPSWLCWVQYALAGLISVWAVWRLNKKMAKIAAENIVMQADMLRKQQRYWTSILANDRSGLEQGFQRPERWASEEAQEDYDAVPEASPWTKVCAAFMMWRFWSGSKTSLLGEDSIVSREDGRALSRFRPDETPPKPEPEPEIEGSSFDYII